MGVTFILAAAAAALLSLTAYRRAQRTDPELLAENMQQLRQATSVVLAIGNAFWAVMDALQLLFRPSRYARLRGSPEPEDT